MFLLKYLFKGYLASHSKYFLGNPKSLQNKDEEQYSQACTKAHNYSP